MHIGPDSGLLIDPGKPALFIDGIFLVQIDPCRDIGRILILAFQTCFHTGQMYQTEHLAPIRLVVFRDGICGITDGSFYQLHLFNPVLDQLVLLLQRVFHHMIIRCVHSDLPDIVQRKSQKFQ